MNKLVKGSLISLISSGILMAVSQFAIAAEADFEDLTLPPESFYNGADNAGGFTSEGVFFNNTFDPEFESWAGWSYSNTTDTTTPGFVNQFSAFPGSGADSSNSYAVAFTFGAETDPFMPGASWLDIPAGNSPKSVQVANTTYTALSMLQGDEFAKQFGGSTGDDPDFLRLTISGISPLGEAIGAIDFYLADYRFEDNSQDFVLADWADVNLSELEGASRLVFSLSSSDNNPQFGMNTPAYFALDNFEFEPDTTVAVPESSSIVGLITAGMVLASSLRQRFPSS